MKYKVKANIGGRRIMTDITFRCRRKAQEYASATNVYRHNANARVVKVR